MEDMADTSGGMTRRTLIKRGAIGGTLVWAAPAIETFVRPAMAAGTPLPNAFCGRFTGGRGKKNVPFFERPNGGGKKLAEIAVPATPIVSEDELVQFSFELHCLAQDEPNTLELHVPDGSGGRDNFHLQTLLTASCVNDPALQENPPVACFDTFSGTGVGRFNGQPGYTITFTMTDNGEPNNDTLQFVITDPDGNVVAEVTESYGNGNFQAHASTGSGARLCEEAGLPNTCP